MVLLLLSFVAGVLTVLAPCVLPLLPVIIGGSLDAENKLKPYQVIAGLVISVTLFTLLLKASTLLIDIDPLFWKIVSAGILVIFGLIYLFPSAWDTFSIKLNLSTKSDKLLDKAGSKKSWLANMLLGAALGPVFASCSPTYFLIIATILPVNFTQGLIYILAYCLGLASVMLAIALLGRQLIKKLKVFANPNGNFKKVLGIIFIIVGLAVGFGIDKQIETSILNSNFFDVTQIEEQLIERNIS